MRTNELMLYKHMEEGQILNDMTFLMENYANDYCNMEDMKGLLFDLVNEILEPRIRRKPVAQLPDLPSCQP